MFSCRPKQIFFGISASIIFILVVLLALPSDAARRRGIYYVTARSAILANAKTGKRFYGKNIDSRVSPASTTKVMTALLVLERLSLDADVVISRNATLPQPSKIYAQVGEKYKVSDLLYALMLNSANDASVALAEAVAGSEEKFVVLMNQRAAQLGARHTRFVNSHGLPSKQEQYTTASDMFLMFKAALKYPFFETVIRTKYKTITSSTGRAVPLKSHNKILFNEWEQKLYGKTGYTRRAQACFVGYVPKGNETYIVAVFGCKKRWKDIRYIVSRFGGIRL